MLSSLPQLLRTAQSASELRCRSQQLGPLRRASGVLCGTPARPPLVWAASTPLLSGRFRAGADFHPSPTCFPVLHALVITPRLKVLRRGLLTKLTQPTSNTTQQHPHTQRRLLGVSGLSAQAPPSLWRRAADAKKRPVGRSIVCSNVKRVRWAYRPVALGSSRGSCSALRRGSWR